MASPFTKAVAEHRLEIIRYLLESGMHPSPDEHLLHFAVRRYQCATDLTELLLPFYDINDLDVNGYTPLFYANSKQMAKWLLARGADIAIKCRQGKLAHEVIYDTQTSNFVEQQYALKFPPVVAPGPRGKIYKTQIPWSERFSTENIAISDLKPVESSRGLFCLELDGHPYEVSRRFMNSFARKMKFSSNVLNYFTPEEVFARVSERNPGVRFRLTLDHQTNVALGVVDANAQILPAHVACNVFANDPRLLSIDYNDGIFEAKFALPRQFAIENDSTYNEELYLQYPVDGVGNPCFYLAVLRQICSNGQVALVPGFRTDIVINDYSGNHLARLLRSYNNENGFELLEKRLKAAQKTEASVSELLRIEKLLYNHIPSMDLRVRLQERLMDMAGDPCARYSTTSLGNIAPKRRPLLPAGCSVNDLFTFCTELATHHFPILDHPSSFNTEISQMMCQDYDLEGLYTRNRQARAYHFEDMKLAVTDQQVGEANA